MFYIYVLSISANKAVGEFHTYEEAIEAEKYLVGIFGEANVLLTNHKEKSDSFNDEWKRKIETIENENLIFCHIDQEWIPCKMTSSLKQSLNVINLLQYILPKSIPIDLHHKNLDSYDSYHKNSDNYYYIQAYQNDFEQGFTVSAEGFCFYICENRDESCIGFYRGDFADPHGLSILAYHKGFKQFKSPKECAVAIAEEIQRFYKFDGNLLML
jgi:hypothetical protein